MASTGVVHKRDEIYTSVKAVDESIATAGEDHHLNVAEIATTVECVLTPEGREFMIVQPGQFYIPEAGVRLSSASDLARIGLKISGESCITEGAAKIEGPEGLEIHCTFAEGLMVYPTVPRCTRRENVPDAIKRLIDAKLSCGGVIEITGMWKESNKIAKNKCFMQRVYATSTGAKGTKRTPAEPQRGGGAVGKQTGVNQGRAKKPKKSESGGAGSAMQTSGARDETPTELAHRMGGEKGMKYGFSCDWMYDQTACAPQQGAGQQADGVLTTSHEIVHGHRPVDSIHGHTILGAPCVVAKTAHERARSANPTMGPKTWQGFYAGRTTNESPTWRILMPDDQEGLGATSKGEPHIEWGGKTWQIRGFSHTKVKAFENIYGDKRRLEPSVSGPKEGDDIKIFEAARHAATKERRAKSKSSKARGRPAGWKPGRSYTEQREINERAQRAAGGEVDAAPTPSVIENPSAEQPGAERESADGPDVEGNDDGQLLGEDEDDEPPPLISDSESSDDEDEEDFATEGQAASGGEEDDGPPPLVDMIDSDEDEAEPARPPPRPAGERYSRRLQGEQAANEEIHLTRQIRQIKEANEMHRMSGRALSQDAQGKLETEHGRSEALVYCMKQHAQGVLLDSYTNYVDEAHLGTDAGRDAASKARGQAQLFLYKMQVATPEERARELEEKLQKSEENDEEILKAQLNATPITQGGRILTDEEILALPTLRNPADVLVDPRWFQLWESNRKERDSWIETETAEFVHKSEVPEHVKPVMVRPLHHAKPAAKGGIDKYKSRYPIDGSMMGVDVHFDGSTFAPTPSATEVKVFFACAAHGMMEHGEVPYLMDISTAFLSTDVCPVHGAVYAWIPGAWYLADLSLQEVMNERERLLQMKVNDPEEFKRERKRWERAYPDYLLKCKSRVYGDPSASRAFYDKSLNHILAAGFQRNQAAPCTYTLAKPIGWFAENTEDGELKNEILRAATAQEGETEMELMVVQHVDDYAVDGQNLAKRWFKHYMEKEFKIGFFGPIETFLGMAVKCDMENGTIKLSQPALIEAAWHRFGKLCEERNILNCTEPALEGTDFHERPTADEVEEYKGLPLASIGGTASYCAQWTRPETVFAARQISSYYFEFGKKEFEAGLRLLSYLNETKHEGITFTGKQVPFGMYQVWGNADASFGLKCYNCAATFLNGGPVTCGVKKIESQMTSSGHAEVAGQNENMKNCIGVLEILRDPCMPERTKIGGTPILIGDNIACVKACTSLGTLTAMVRHVEKQCLYVREQIAMQKARMIWWPTNDMMADIGTKAVGKIKFHRHKPELTGAACAEAVTAGKVAHGQNYEPYSTSKEGASRFEPKNKKKDVRTVAYLREHLKEITERLHALQKLGPMGVEKQALVQIQRQGFPPVKLLRKMAKEQVIQGLIFPESMANNEQFLQKLEGRFRKDASKSEDSWDPGMRTWQPLFYMVCDCMELSVADANGCRFAYIFYDAKCSRYRFVYPVQRKSLYWKVLQKMILRCRSYGWTVGVLKTDGAKEMVGQNAQDILELYGVRPLESSPYTPEENGHAEACVREIKDLARVLMANAKHLPDQLGMDAVVHAANLLNMRGFTFRKQAV